MTDEPGLDPGMLVGAVVVRDQMNFKPWWDTGVEMFGVERWFGLITQQAIRRGSLRNVKELVQKIDAYVINYNLHRRPFIWTATADSILTKLQRLCKVINGTSH